MKTYENFKKMSKYKFTLLLVIMFNILLACKTSKIHESSDVYCNDCLKITRYGNGVNENTKLVFQNYEYEDKSKWLPFFYVLIDNNTYKDSLVVINKSLNKINIQLDYVSKERIYTKDFNIQDSDSIIIKAYLKDNKNIIFE